MSNQHYIRDPATGAVRTAGLMEWAQWLEDSGDDRIVARTEIGGVTVSTVFLGRDHSFADKGPPVLYETMIFDEREEGTGYISQARDYQERYCTEAEARLGHARAVLLVEQEAANAE